MTMALTRKQKDILDFIIDYENLHGLSPTQREIKEHFGLKSFGSVQKYLQYLGEGGHLKKEWNERRGLKVISPKLKSRLKMSKEALNKNQLAQNQQEAIEIPYLGQAAAGNPIEAHDDSLSTISVPISLVKSQGNFFAISVKGDSMINAGILDRDTAIFQSVQTADDGKIIVASIDGEATIKYLKKVKGKIHLLPANSHYQPIVIDEYSGDFKILGILIGLLRTY